MMKGYLKDHTPGMQFLFTLMIFVCCWLVFQIIAVVSGIFIYDIGFSEISR